MQQSEFDYRKYLGLIRKHKRLFAVVALVVMAGAVVLSYVLPKKYQAKSTVFIEKSVIADLVKGIAITPSIEDKIKVLTYALSSRTLLTKVIDELDLNAVKSSEADLETMVKEFQSRMEIKVKDKESLFTISFTHEDPRIARDFVNTLVRRYIEENVSSKREESYGATQFLSDQIGTFKEKLSKAEDEVEAFKRNQGMLLASSEGSLQQEIANAQQRLDDMRARRTQLESMRNILKKSDPLQTHVTALQKRLEELRTQYTDSYPEVIRVQTELETAREQMKKRGATGAPLSVDPQELEKIEVELRSIRAIEDAQTRIIARNQGMLRSIPVAKTNLEQLEQEKNNQKALYETLVARHGQSEVSKQMEVQDKSTTFRIVDPAIMPIKPVSPDRVKLMLIGIAAGLAAGMGVLVLIDMFDRSVKNADALKVLGVQVLAVIPRITDPAETARARRSDLRLYLLVGTCFLVILSFLITEAVGFSVVDKVVALLKGHSA